MKKTVLMSAAKKARIALAVMAVCGFTFAGVQSAFAADSATEHPVKIDVKNNIVCGTGAKVEKATGSTVDPANDIVIGVNAIANDKNSIAIGTGANAKAENSVAIGYGSVADAADTISFGSAANYLRNKRLVNLAAGKDNNDAATYGQVITSVKQNGNKLEFYTGTNTTNAAMDVELYHPVKFEGSNLIGGSGAKVGEGRRIDTFSITSPNNNVVLGNKAQANGEYNVVMGVGAIANNYRSIVIGESAKGDVMSVAMGAFAEDSGGGVAIGFNAKNKGTAAIGSSSKADGFMAIAIGGDAKATGSGTIAMSYKSEASKENAMAFGEYAKAISDNTIAMGYFSEASKEKSIAIGYYAKATGTDSIAIRGTASGYKSKAFGGTASGDYSIAIGGTAAEAYSYAIGGQAKGKYSVSIGEGSVATDRSTVSVGSGVDDGYGGFYSAPGYRRIVNVQDGYNNHDAATYGQIIKKDTYTISLDNAGSGQAVLKTNADKEGPTIKVDASALETQITKNASDITAVDGKVGTLSADGTYIKKTKNVSDNLVELDNQVNANATALTNKANLDLSNINAAGETKIKDLAKTEAGTVLTGELGTITSTNYVSASGKVNENISKLDTQVKANADDIIAANTKITNVDNKIGSLSTDGTYIKKTKNVSDNLVELDNQVNANATALTSKANLDLSNISAAGETKIKDLASIKAGEVVNVKLGAITSTHYVTTGNTVNANISALDTQLNNVDNKIGTMTNGNYVTTDNTVAGNLSALDNQLKVNTDAIAEKADKNLSNITDAGKNVIKDLAGNKAGEVVADKLGTITSNNYVSAGNTVNANISKLDEQVKANADAINTKADKDLSNITDAGKNVIKDLAGNKAGEVVDAKLGDITSNNYVNAGNTVNANISALDKQMKVNTDNIGDTNKLTTAGLGSNLSDAVVKVNDKVGDTSKLTTANLGNNLSDAVVKVDDKTKQNAKDIEKVNGRVDELGGRVDTLGGAVAKLDSRVNKVGAGAAALAALHPMEFDSDNKLSFAAGVGNYRGTNAAAIGAFYRPSEQVMFSISGNMGNGENMVNAGVSFALDRPSKTPTTKAALVKTVVAQNEQIAALNETVAEQSNALEAQSKEIAELKAMVQQLAAKQNA